MRIVREGHAHTTRWAIILPNATAVAMAWGTNTGDGVAPSSKHSIHGIMSHLCKQESFMDSGILLIWIGALLIIGGVLYGAAQALWGGRLSDARLGRSARTEASLEPRQGARAFSFKTHWPAFVLILLGSLLLLTETAF